MDNITRRFIYFYFNRNEPEKIRRVVAAHVQYWKTASLKKYRGGPFSDRTGGLISFAASSLEEATEIILRDPFVLEDLIAEKWIKEWIVGEEERTVEAHSTSSPIHSDSEDPPNGRGAFLAPEL